MRVAPVGWAFDTLEKTLAEAKKSAECTHNHPEGIKGAQATAAAIFLARSGKSKEEIRDSIVQTFGGTNGGHGRMKEMADGSVWIKKDHSDWRENIKDEFLDYRLRRTLAEIRPYYTFDVTCEGTVPVALLAFLESENFTDAIQKAISIGGDTDTIACITGGVAEAFYQNSDLGIPQKLKDFVLGKIDIGEIYHASNEGKIDKGEVRDLIERFYSAIQKTETVERIV